MNIVEKRMKDLAKSRRKQQTNIFKKSLEANSSIIKDSSFNLLNDLMKEIANLGLPFQRHRKGSKIYLASAKKLARVYKKHRSEVIEVFKLGHEYFNNSNFIYRPNTIPISEFIKFSSEYKKFNQYAGIFSEKYNVKSLFKEFLKGKDYIDSKYLRKTIQKVDNDLLLEAIKIWNRYKSPVEESEKQILNRFIVICEEYSKINSRATVSNIFYLLENEILSKASYNISYLNFLISKAFWNDLLPKVIINYGLYDNRAYLKKLERFNE